MLGMLLMMPWLLVLGFLYWMFPRSLPQTSVRRVFDLAAISLSLIAAAVTATLAHHSQQIGTAGLLDHSAGEFWPEALAVLMAYGVFSALLLAFFGLRALLWRRRP